MRFTIALLSAAILQYTNATQIKGASHQLPADGETVVTTLELTCDEKKAEINGLFTEQALLSEEEFNVL